MITAGTVSVDAGDASTIHSLVGGVAVATKGGAIGFGVGVNDITDTITGAIDGSSVTAGGDITVSASEDADIQALSVGAAGGKAAGGAASVSLSTIDDSATARIGGASGVDADGGAVNVLADNAATIGNIAGQLALDSNGVAVGAAVGTATVANVTQATISGDSTVTGTRGVTVAATSSDNLTNFAIGAGASGGATVEGAVTVSTVNDITGASIGAPSGKAGTITAGTGSGSIADLTVAATSTLVLLGTAGSLALGSDAGVGAGADAGVITRRTQASIGANAVVKADRDVLVAATSSEQLVSVSATGAGSGGTAVSATAGVSILDLATTAWIDSGATVAALNNVVVSAQDQTNATGISGSLDGGGDAAIGVAAEIGTVNKTTEAYIASDAVVTAAALDGGTAANTGKITAGSDGGAQQSTASIDFQTSAVSANEISGNTSGFSTGDEVTYAAQDQSLGGLENHGVYYIIVVDAHHFELAASASDAQAGTAIALSDGFAASSDQHVVTQVVPVGVPSVDSSAFDASANGIDAAARDAVSHANQHGVVVTAVSTDVLTQAGAAAGASGGVAAGAAGAVSVDTINTLAHIDSGATVTATAASGTPGVSVVASRSVDDLLIGVGADASGGFAASAGVAVPVLTGTISALITGASVTATGDVDVTAQSQESIIAVAAGVAGSGDSSLAGSAAAVAVGVSATNPMDVQAEIGGGATVTAGGNVLVSATDATTDYAIAGAAGIGLGGAAGAGAVALTEEFKSVTALIDDSTVSAGATGTAALTGVLSDGALPNSGYATESVQGVAVQALSSQTVYDVAGSGAGGGFAGAAGAVTVESLNVNVTAAIQHGATVTSGGGVAVGAGDSVTILAVAGALGAGGAAGIGAGVDVDILRDNTSATIGAATVTATGTVDVNAQSQRDVQSYADAAGAGGLALGGGVAVLSIGGSYTDGYSSSDDGGDSTSGDAFANKNVTGNADTAISKGIGGLQTDDSGGSDPSNQARSDNAASLPSNPAGSETGSSATGSSTTASIDGSSGTPAQVTAAAVNVSAQQAMSVKVEAGGAGLATGIAIGAGVAVVTVQSDVSATIGPYATLIATGNGAVNVDAVRDASLSVEGIAGAASGFVSLGAAVASVHDTSSVAAFAGGVVTGDGTHGFHGVTVDAEDSDTIGASSTAANLSTGLAAGAAVTVINADARTTADIGTNASVASQGAVTVSATQTQTVQGWKGTQPVAIGLSVGSGAFGAADANVNVGGTVAANIDKGASVSATNAVNVTATGSIIANNLTIDGDTGGILAVGLILGTIGMSAAVAAGVGEGAAVSGSSVKVSADDEADAEMTATPASGGIISGDGARVTATGSATTSATIGSGAVVNAASGDVTVQSTAKPALGATVQGESYGVVTVGVSRGTATLTNTNTAAIDASAVISVPEGDVTLKAVSTPDPFANTTGTGGGGISVEEADSTASLTDNTSALVGQSATIAAFGTVTIDSSANVKVDPEATVNAAGLGVNTKATAAGTLQNTTTTDIGAGATIAAGTVSVVADLSNVNAQATTNSTATALGDDFTATSTLTTNVAASVTLEAGAEVVGANAASFQALVDSLSANGTANATSNGAGANTSPTVTNAETVAADVTGASTALVRTGALDVEANVPYAPGEGTNANQNGALIDVGSSSASATLAYNRQINWNATLDVTGAPDPSLVIAANGSLLATGVTATESSGTVTVAAINYTGPLSGKITFNIAKTAVDNASGVLSGSLPEVFQSSFDSVDITNYSADALVLNGINPQNTSNQPSPNVKINAPISSSFLQSKSVVAAPTAIDIVNLGTTGTPNITLDGAIQNSAGSTTIEAGRGSILWGAAAENVQTAALVLNTTKAIGSAANPLAIAATGAVTASAGTGLYLAQTGALSIDAITAGTTASVAATGSITSSGTVTAPVVALNSSGGSVGTAAAPIDVVSAGGSAVALSGGGAKGFYITGADGFTLGGTVAATSGNIAISVPDLGGARPGIVETGTVSDLGGNVTLSSAGDLSVTGIISASGTVTLDGDQTNGGTVSNQTITLSGDITGTAVVVNTGPDNDTVVIVDTNSPTTVNSESIAGTSSVIQAGSVVTGSKYTLAAIKAQLSVNGGAGADTVQLLDTGNTASMSWVYTGGTLTGGAAPIVIASTGTTVSVDISLGSGDSSFSALSTDADIVTNVTFGAGNNTATLGDGRLTHMAGAVNLTAQSNGNINTVNVNNGSGSGNTGALDASGSTQTLSGLGLGADLSWTAFDVTNITVGRNPNFTVNGTPAKQKNSATETNISQVNGSVLLTDEEGFGSGLSVTGQNNTQVTLTAQDSSALTLGSTAAGDGLITGADFPQGITFELDRRPDREPALRRRDGHGERHRGIGHDRPVRRQRRRPCHRDHAQSAHRRDRKRQHRDHRSRFVACFGRAQRYDFRRCDPGDRRRSLRRSGSDRPAKRNARSVGSCRQRYARGQRGQHGYDPAGDQHRHGHQPDHVHRDRQQAAGHAERKRAGYRDAGDGVGQCGRHIPGSDRQCRRPAGRFQQRTHQGLDRHRRHHDLRAGRVGERERHRAQHRGHGRPGAHPGIGRRHAERHQQPRIRHDGHAEWRHGGAGHRRRRAERGHGDYTARSQRRDRLQFAHQRKNVLQRQRSAADHVQYRQPGSDRRTWNL